MHLQSALPGMQTLQSMALKLLVSEVLGQPG
jgi:hypothetical protein